MHTALDGVLSHVSASLPKKESHAYEITSLSVRVLPTSNF
jgi:hypothetical protein